MKKSYLPLSLLTAATILPACVKNGISDQLSNERSHRNSNSIHQQLLNCFDGGYPFIGNDLGQNFTPPILTLGRQNPSVGCIMLDFTNSDLDTAKMDTIFNGIAAHFAFIIGTATQTPGSLWNTITFTTDPVIYAYAVNDKKIRVNFTRSTDTTGEVSGESIIGGYNDPSDDTTHKLCVVRTVLLGHNPKTIIDVACHQIGHSLGLLHHHSYNPGCVFKSELDSGTVVEAPIMGYSNCSQNGVWKTDTCSGQNDSLLIKNAQLYD